MVTIWIIQGASKMWPFRETFKNFPFSNFSFALKIFRFWKDERPATQTRKTADWVCLPFFLRQTAFQATIISCLPELTKITRYFGQATSEDGNFPFFVHQKRKFIFDKINLRILTCFILSAAVLPKHCRRENLLQTFSHRKFPTLNLKTLLHQKVCPVNLQRAVTFRTDGFNKLSQAFDPKFHFRVENLSKL